MSLDFEALRAGVAQAVPYNRHLGLEVVELGPGRAVVRLPDDERLLNHVATQHAGALFSAGEAASGAAFLGAFAARLAELTPLAASATIHYRAPAQGLITAEARLDAEPSALIERLDRDGAVRFPVAVRLTDAQDRLVAEMTVDWHIRRRAPG